MINEDKWSNSELLRLAATACGYKWSWDIEKERYALKILGLYIPNVSTLWNPIEDSGQALELAARLSLRMQYMDGIIGVGRGVEKPTWLAYELYRHKESEATRLAIVKAAAVIGGEKNRPGSKVYEAPHK